MNIAIVGATGNVGRKIIEVLEKKELSIDNLYLLASSKSAGSKIKFYQIYLYQTTNQLIIMFKQKSFYNCRSFLSFILLEIRPPLERA